MNGFSPTPEFNQAAAKYFALKRAGLAQTEPGLAARAEMLKHAPDSVHAQLAGIAENHGLTPASPAKQTTELLDRLMSKGGAA